MCMAYTKQEAAQYLNITVRAIENAVAKGKLDPVRVKGQRGIQWQFETDELDRYKQARSTMGFVPGRRPAEHQTTLAAPQDTSVLNQLVSALEKIIRPAPPPAVPIEAKLTLSLAEASQLSGFSADHLREAIRADLLKTVVIGTSGKRYRIRRGDLDRYIKRL